MADAERPAGERVDRGDVGGAVVGQQALELVGVDVVEVIPTAPGSADITALVADRIVREALTGLAVRKRSAS